MRRPLKINELERDSFVKGTFHLSWYKFVAIHFITTVRRNYSLLNHVLFTKRYVLHGSVMFSKIPDLRNEFTIELDLKSIDVGIISITKIKLVSYR